MYYTLIPQPKGGRLSGPPMEVLSVYGCFCLPVCLSVCSSTLLLSVCLSVSLNAYLLCLLWVFLYTFLSVCLLVHLTNYLLVNLVCLLALSVCWYFSGCFCMPVCLSVHSSIYPTVCLSVCLSVYFMSDWEIDLPFLCSNCSENSLQGPSSLFLFIAFRKFTSPRFILFCHNRNCCHDSLGITGLASGIFI